MHIAVQRGHFGPEAAAHVEMSAIAMRPEGADYLWRKMLWGCGEILHPSDWVNHTARENV
jgi:hypothetical protein